MNYKTAMGLVWGATLSSGYALVYLTNPISHPDFWFGLMMATIIGGVISGVVCMTIPETYWAQKQRAMAQPFGLQRVEIMENQWRLQDLKDRFGDPDERLQKAINQCYQNLAKLDLAVVTMYQSEIEKVKAQSVEVDLALQNAQEDLERFRSSERQSDATIRVVPVSMSGRVAQRQ